MRKACFLGSIFHSTVVPAMLCVVLFCTTTALSESNLTVEVDGNGHLWAENDFYKWDVSHGTELSLKMGQAWHNWRIPGFESYEIELGDGGGNPTSPSYGICNMSDLVIQSIDNRGTFAVVMLSGVFNFWQQPLSVKMTFYAHTSFVRLEVSVGNVWSDPHPPAVWWRVSLVPGGDTSPGDYYHYSGQSGEASFPYDSWTRIYESSFQTVGSTDFVYITDYDKEARQGFAMIARLQETADAITDINYGRAVILDYHGYGGYSVMTIHANSVMSPTVYWFFYEADPSVAYQPVEDLINSCDTIEGQAIIQPSPQYVYYSFAIEPWTDTVCIGNFTCGYTAEDVDTSTLLINGTIHPTATIMGEELCLTFLLPQFIRPYGELYDTTLHTYTVTGSMTDGTPLAIEGEVTIIGKSSQNPSQYIVPTDQVVLRADCNRSGFVNIADITYLVAFIFNGGERPVPHLVGDANCSLSVNVADVVYLVQYIFSGGLGPCSVS